MLPRYLIYCFDGWVGPQTETVATGHIYDKKLYLGTSLPIFAMPIKLTDLYLFTFALQADARDFFYAESRFEFLQMPV